MLVLTRQTGETIMIGDGIAVTLLGIKGRYARIGIIAPDEVSVHRMEIYEKIRNELNTIIGTKGSKTDN